MKENRFYLFYLFGKGRFPFCIPTLLLQQKSTFQSLRTDDYCWSLNRLLWTECCVQEQVITRTKEYVLPFSITHEIKVVIDYVCKPLRYLGYEIENHLQVHHLDIIWMEQTTLRKI